MGYERLIKELKGCPLRDYLVVLLSRGKQNLSFLKDGIIKLGYETKCQPKNLHGAIRKIISVHPDLFSRLEVGVYGLRTDYGASKLEMPKYKNVLKPNPKAMDILANICKDSVNELINFIGSQGHSKMAVKTLDEILEEISALIEKKLMLKRELKEAEDEIGRLKSMIKSPSLPSDEGDKRNTSIESRILGEVIRSGSKGVRSSVIKSVLGLDDKIKISSVLRNRISSGEVLQFGSGRGTTYFMNDKLSDHKKTILEKKDSSSKRKREKGRSFKESVRLFLDFVNTNKRYPTTRNGFNQPEDSRLAKWVSTQKSFYHSGKLKKNNEEMLNSIPHWDWDRCQNDEQVSLIVEYADIDPEYIPDVSDDFPEELTPEEERELDTEATETMDECLADESAIREMLNKDESFYEAIDNLATLRTPPLPKSVGLVSNRSILIFSIMLYSSQLWARQQETPIVWNEEREEALSLLQSYHPTWFVKERTEQHA